MIFKRFTKLDIYIFKNTKKFHILYIYMCVCVCVGKCNGNINGGKQKNSSMF